MSQWNMRLFSTRGGNRTGREKASKESEVAARESSLNQDLL